MHVHWPSGLEGFPLQEHEVAVVREAVRGEDGAGGHGGGAEGFIGVGIEVGYFHFRWGFEDLIDIEGWILKERFSEI
jgi:hypothetical protein